MSRLSCHRFRSNEVRLSLRLIAYDLGNLWRRLVLPRKIDNWSLTILQQRLVRAGGRLIKHARYYWLMLAESHLTRRLFGAMAGRIAPCRCRRGRGRRWEQRNQGAQGVTAGGVFVECAEMAGFRGFGFSRQSDNPALRGRRRLPEERMQLAG